MTAVISIRDLRKRYRMRDGETIALRMKRMLFPDTDAPPKEHFWALDGITLDIQAGDVLGIVGRNGAGKSTLLKILSRVTVPTSGTVEIRGRVGSLLEVGAGLHSDLTGRENVMFCGAIFGMSRAEIRSKFDEIVDFAEIGQFLDMPVRHYSSGMQVRLGFAVAAYLNPQILILDEALAVGDAAFQAKSLRKIAEIAKEGFAVLYVSHSSDSIRQLCNTACILERGRLVDHGPVNQIVDKYDVMLAGPAGAA